MESLRYIILKPVALLCFILISGNMVLAQSGPSQQLWLDYNPKHTINNKWLVYSDIGYRYHLDGNWNKYLGRFSFSYKPFVLKTEYNFFKNMEFHGGMGYFYTDVTDNPNIGEFRLIQGVRAYWPILKRVKFSHFIRLEERFEKIQNYDYNDVSVRFRYALKANLRFKAPALSNLFFPLSAEIFPNLSKGITFNDVVRLTAGAGYDFTDSFKFNFNVSWHKSRDDITGDLTSDIIVYRLRFYTTF